MRRGVRKRTRTRIEAILADAISSACVHGSSRWGFSDNAASTSSGPSHTGQQVPKFMLNQLDPKRTPVPWESEVVVIEKTFPKISLTSPKKYQWLTYMDEQGNKIQATIYEQDIEKYKNTFLVGGYYKIENAYIKPNLIQFRTVPNENQLTIGSSTLVEELLEDHFEIDFPYDYLPISAITPRLGGTAVNVLGAIIGSFPPEHTKEADSKLVQRFLLMDKEFNVIVLKLWNQFVHDEGAAITSIIRAKPIVAGLRLRVMHFNGVLLSSWKSCCFLINPNIPQATELRAILTTHAAKVDEIAKENSMSKNMEVALIKTVPKVAIQELLALETDITYCVNGKLTPIKVQNKCWYMGCSNCLTTTSALYKETFTCFNCKKADTRAMPRAKLEAKLEDPTGVIEGTFFGVDAEAIIGLDAHKLLKATIKERLSAFAPWLDTGNQPNQDVNVRMSSRSGLRRYVFSFPIEKQVEPHPLAMESPSALTLPVTSLATPANTSSSKKMKEKMNTEDTGEEFLFGAKRRLEFVQDTPGTCEAEISSPSINESSYEVQETPHSLEIETVKKQKWEG